MPIVTTSAKPADSPTIGRGPSPRWFAIFAVTYGLWVWLPFLAPLAMHFGWSGLGRAVYFFYSFFCHQLPERSFFLFGRTLMYPLSTIEAAGVNSLNPFILRRFIGNDSLGWKVAWSDRMISFYMSIWFFAVVWQVFRRNARPLPWWGLILFLLPIVLDGGSHAVSDLSGIGQGFRYTNAWLAALTSYAFPASFYAGDAIGSFNSIMRLITGVLAGLGLVWFAFPHVETSFAQDES